MRKLLFTSASVLALAGFAGTAQAQIVNFAENNGDVFGQIDISAGGISNGSFSGLTSTTAVNAQNTGTISIATPDSNLSVGNIEVFTDNLFGETFDIEDDVFDEEVLDEEAIDLNASIAEAGASIGNFAENTTEVNADIFIDVDNNIDGSFGGLSTTGVSAINDGTIDIEGGDITASVGNIDIFTGNTFEDDVDFGEDIFDDDVIDEEVIDLDVSVTEFGTLELFNEVDNDVNVNAEVDIQVGGDINNSFNGVTEVVTNDNGTPDDDSDDFDETVSTVISTVGAGALNTGGISLATGDVSTTVGNISIFADNDFQRDLALGDQVFENEVFDEEVIDVDASLAGLVAYNGASNSGEVNANIQIDADGAGNPIPLIKDSFNDVGDADVQNGISTLAIGAQNTGDISIEPGTVSAEVGNLNVFTDNKFNSAVVGDPEFDAVFADHVFEGDVIDADASGVAVNASVGDIRVFSNNSFYDETSVGTAGNPLASDLFEEEVFEEEIIDADYAVIDTSITLENFAFNSGVIDGSFAVEAGAIDGSFSNVSTTVAGAINTGTISVGSIDTGL